MFCRKCGKTLLDGDRFCSYCGAQVIERNDCISTEENLEEVVYNKETISEKPVNDSPGINNNGIPEKSIAQTWQGINENNKDGQPKADWNLTGFPVSGEQHKKTEDIKVDWKKREFLTFESTVQEQKDVGDTPIDVKPELKDEKKSKQDIFEIFDKQLEEEKVVKDKKVVEEDKGVVGVMPQVSEPSLEQELFGRTNIINKKVHTPAEEQIDKFYTFSQKNEEFQKLLDKEYERLKKVSDFTPPEPKGMSNIENLSMDLPENIFEKEEKDEPAFEKTIKETDEGNVQQTDEEHEQKKEYEEHTIEGNINNTVESTMLEQLENQESQKNEETITEEIKETSEEESTELPILPWDEMESPLAEFTDEDEGKKTSPLTVILIIIIILLAFEIAILGIKCFLPESGAAAFINDKLGVAVNWVDSLKSEQTNNVEDEKQKNKEEQIEKDKDEKAQEASAIPQADPVPNPDKEALIKEAIAYNKNIKSIKADKSLVYVENKDYSDKNINNSKTIENNIWYEDKNGNTVYYDKEIVKTIIQFDSAWIDYVNNKDDSVLSLAKEGSKAYENAKTYSKVGKISETFDILKIGEIRQGGNGFYLWVNETITITENGKDKTINYNWIYYLEPVDKQMKIVSYTKF